MARQFYYRCSVCGILASSSENRKDIERVINKLCIPCYVKKRFNMEIKDYLEYLYFKKDLSTDQIGLELEITQNAVRNLFKKLGIKSKKINDIRKSEKSKNKHLLLLDKGYEIESLAKEILSKENFKIIDEPYWGYYLNKNKLTNLGYHSYDYLCKKENVIYIIDIKDKLYTDDRRKNYFYVTKNEIITFDHYMNRSDVKIKILVIITKKNSLLYHFYNWKEFIIPDGVFRGKYNNTVRIRLKKNLNINEFKESIYVGQNN